MKLRTLWKTRYFVIWLAICAASPQIGAGFQDQEEQSKPSATCATPVANRAKKQNESKPYARPTFHQPQLNQSEIDRSLSGNGSPKLDPKQFESAIETPIIRGAKPSRLPELNRLQNVARPAPVPELNAPSSTPPEHKHANETSPTPTLPTKSRPMEFAESSPMGDGRSHDVGQFEDFNGFEFNFSDAGVGRRPFTMEGCGPSVSGPLMPLRSRSDRRFAHTQQTASALWPNCPPERDLAWMPPESIGSQVYQGAPSLVDSKKRKVEEAKNVPGLIPNTKIPASTASTAQGRTHITQLPRSKTQSKQQTGSIESNRNSSILIHPPMLQPYNRNQHTFVVENRSDNDVEEVVVEISVPKGDRIVAALPENSVTSKSVSMFKFPRIASGESVPIHVTAVSDDQSPVEFSASLVSRAVYSFHIQEGQKRAKLSNVSYLNDTTNDLPIQMKKGQGPVRVTNPFFGGQRRPNQTARSAKPGVR